MSLSLRWILLLTGAILCFGTACSISQQLAKQQKMIVGLWQLESATVNGTTIPATMLGGAVVFDFRSDGTAQFLNPDGKTESGKYELRDSKIYDPDSPGEQPIEVVSMEKSKMVLRMTEKGDPILMTMLKK